MGALIEATELPNTTNVGNDVVGQQRQSPEAGGDVQADIVATDALNETEQPQGADVKTAEDDIDMEGFRRELDVVTRGLMLQRAAARRVGRPNGYRRLHTPLNYTVRRGHDNPYSLEYDDGDSHHHDD